MHGTPPPGTPSEKEGHGKMRPTSPVEGIRVGDWRVLWRFETGAFGVVHLVVRVGQEAAGPAALKMARVRGDPRFLREAQLLARVLHPNVPRLRGQGEWYGLPYVVMDWVDGAPLYRWAQQCNPTPRQAAGLLAQLAGALAAVHAAGGAHRDLKGDNVLVRLSDGAALLTDFGASTWQGAAPLTVGAPPGTPLYYSPERLRAHLNLLPPEAPSGAGPADDVYALGVTAFRLLTDCYPFLEVEEAQRTQARLEGRLPRAPHALNPEVPPELGALVLRMMAARPEERPSAPELARALGPLSSGPEQAEQAPLFAWVTESSQLGPGRRLPSRVEYERWLVQARIDEGRARVSAEAARVQSLPPPAAAPPPRPAQALRRAAPTASAPRTFAWLPWLVAACAVLVSVLPRPLLPPPAEPRQEAASQAGEPRAEKTTGRGDSPLPAPERAGPREPEQQKIGAEMPARPLPGQLLPPCKKPMVEIRGGCWVGPIEDEKPPCGKQSFAWQGRCYWPFMTPQPPATSSPP
jgi:hypothetical protein